MPSTVPTRHPERSTDSDRTVLDALLDSTVLAHVAFDVDGHPVVVPTGFARDGDSLIVHGSTGSGWMRTLAAVAVTALDALVVARTGFESSFHYRSAVLFGTFTPLEGEQKVAALDRITDRLIPGRLTEVRAATPKELAATLALVMPIRTWSYKSAQEWPDDLPEDVAGPTWAGVVPMRTVYGPALPAPDLATGIAVPPSIMRLS